MKKLLLTLLLVSLSAPAFAAPVDLGLRPNAPVPWEMAKRALGRIDPSGNLTSPIFTDPNADRIVFWDDSAGAFVPLTAGTGLSITGTTITATATGASECIRMYPTTVGGDVVTGTKQATAMVRAAATVTGVYANTNANGTTSAVTVDINELVAASQPGAGASILSTKLTIDAGEPDSSTAATPAVLSDTALAAHSQLIVDVDAADSGNTATGLEVDVCVTYP